MSGPNNKFVAVVLAADRTASDPITIHTGAACKAIAPVCGIPMIIRVLDALAASTWVTSTILCGPSESILSVCPELKQRIDSESVSWLPNLDTPSRSAERGFEQIDDDIPVLLTTADHALLTPEILDYFLSKSHASDGDATVGLVKYEEVAVAFPNAKRTVTRLRDGGFCGCNLFTFNHRGRKLVSFWQQVEALRKRPWQIITKLLSIRIIFSYLFGCLTLESALHAVSNKSGVKIRSIMLPFPQAGVDVDKVADLHLAESVLNKSSPSVCNENN